MKYYIVDVFTDKLFHGNSAGVCLLEDWIDDALMQKIAFENNLAETAFLVRGKIWQASSPTLDNTCYYDLRWFTPTEEIDLCGHATLGSAYVLMNYVDASMKTVEFHTMSGILTVTKNDDRYSMDFPTRKPIPCEVPPLLEKALGANVLETHMSRDLLVLLQDERTVADLKPDFSMLKQIDNVFGFIVTAKGSDCDFVSRFFAPKAGIMEDPVTGSSHTTLIPFWSERLVKKEMLARQLSQRGGILHCKDCGSRVEIEGTAVTYLVGDIVL